MDEVTKDIKITLCGQDFILREDFIQYVGKSNNYNFFKSGYETLSYLIKNTLDDYYLEKVYNHIIQKILNGNEDHDILFKCDIEDNWRFTDKIIQIIHNCNDNPCGKIEFKILKLFSIDNIDWFPYFNKLDDLIYKIRIADKLGNKEQDIISHSNIYKYNFFKINFYKYDFELMLDNEYDCDFKKVQKNLELIKNLNYSNVEFEQTFIILRDLNYKMFDDIIKYLESVL